MVEPNTTDPVLDEILRRLLQEFKPNSIYYFGSKARGDFGPDSDYDLLLVLPTIPEVSREPRYRRMQRAQKVLWGIWTAVDVIILTEDEFSRECTVVCSLPSTVLREGRKLYAA